MKILLLEDDYAYRISVSEYLQNLGYEIDEASNGEIACDKIAKNSYHLLILDIKVPEISGHEVMKYAKNLGLKTPIMLMTSLTSMSDLETGYNLGCNEYLKKPFNLAELKFRVNELMRKYYGVNDSNIVKIGTDFSFDTLGRVLKFNGNEIALSAKELSIVELLLLRRGNFVSSDEINAEIWQGEASSVDIRVHIQKIRFKTHRDFIISVRNLGYKIDE